MSAFATRFAPSPTGALHLGHALSALTAFDAARSARGRFVLRIEDIDTARSRPQFEAAIHEDLAWLGLDWELPVRRQSEHMADYRAALDLLRSRGLLYRCFRTRREVLDAIASAPHAEDKPGLPFRGAALPRDVESRRLAAGDAFAWRLSLDRARAALDDRTPTFVEEGAAPADGPADGQRRIVADARPHGDIVLARKDVGVAYHLAVVVDDALQGITHVVRGEDLFAAASIQVLLQALLGLPTPVYRHHRLLLGPDDQRLAKRNGARSLAELRSEGVTPDQIRAGLGLSAAV